jgi:hypothetical protein
MRKWMWASLLLVPLTIGGLVYANSHPKTEKPSPANKSGYLCPITGEELPCPKCCPLNQAQ